MPARAPKNAVADAASDESIAVSPRGREVTTEKILEAAEKLFAALPPSVVTTRAIAQEAGVNLTLIHRYVGSKDEVLRAVMYRYAKRFKEDVDHASNFEHGLLAMINDPRQESFFRTLAHVVLSGHPLSDVVTLDGGVSALLKTVPKERDEVTKVLALLAMSWGWRLFGEFLLMCAGSRENPDQAREQVMSHLLKALHPAGSAPPQAAKKAVTPRTRKRTSP